MSNEGPKGGDGADGAQVHADASAIKPVPAEVKRGILDGIGKLARARNAIFRSTSEELKKKR